MPWVHNLWSAFYLPDSTDPVSHFLASLNNLFRHAIQNLSESDMVGITTQNRVKQNKPIGISFRPKDQLAWDVIMSLIQKVSQTLDLTLWTSS